MLPSELLSVASLAALILVAFAGTPASPLAALGFASLAAATVLLARRVPVGSFVRTWFPVVTVLATFSLLEPVILGVSPHTLDARLAALDARWLPGVVAAWRGAFGRPSAFTDLVYAVYVSYYLVPVTAVALGWVRGAETCERNTFAVLLVFWASYAGYVLMPASGPRLAPAEEALLMGGGAISAGVRTFLHGAEKTLLDAFPSGHTAISLVSAWAVWRTAPRLLAPFLAWVGMVIFSTVYIHVHYAVDVAAGAVLAGAVVLAAAPLQRALEPAAAALSRRLAGTPPRAAGA